MKGSHDGRGAGASLKRSAKSDPWKNSALKASPRALSRLRWKPLLWIAAAAFAVEIPFFFLGIPSGHDVEFHLYSWLDVLAQWKQGILYPRWAALANFAYGEPRFIFYPPASWTLGAMVSAIFPFILASQIYIWLALVGAGISMFFLARRWFERGDATFAAVLYAVNPYHLTIVYWRSAFAELLASSLLPLLLLLLLRPEAQWRRTVLWLGVVLAGAWLVNAPSAVMIHYSLALLVIGIAWQRRSPRSLLWALAAVALGAALASFYLLPAIYEQKWVNIAEAVSAGSRPLDNFLFVRTGDADHDAFNRLISALASVEVLMTGAAAWTARRWLTRQRELWWSLAIWGAACAMAMLAVSNPLWVVLPKLRFMQFPWRWALCLGVPFSLLMTMGVKRWPARIGLCLTCLCVLIFVGRYFQPPWWDNAADLREIKDNILTGAGYEGTDEYTPVGANPSAVDKSAGRVTVEGPAQAAIRISQWGAERKTFDVSMSSPDRLRLHLFDYPAWRVEVNGRVVRTGALEDTGEMAIPVEAGNSQVRIMLVRTWERTVGGWISLLAVISCAVALKQSARAGPRGGITLQESLGLKP